MTELSKYFDVYSFNARVKPALFLAFPVVLSIFVLVEESRTWGGAATTLLLSFGIINFSASQMSSKGNKLQERLWSIWGGAPTTIILRHSSNVLDRFTKARYVANLSMCVANFTPISEEDERNNPVMADEMYRSGASYLLEYTRDTKKFPLIFKENIGYGFSRNLRAFKGQGIAITVLALLGSLFFVFKDLSFNPVSMSQELARIPFPNYGLIVVHLILLGSWIFLITEEWVKVRGFAYAKRLYAACEQIPENDRHILTNSTLPPSRTI